MNKNHSHSTGKRLVKTNWRNTLTAIFTGALALFLFWQAWSLVNRGARDVGFPSAILFNQIGLIFAHAALVVALEQCFTITSLQTAWRYRLAFLVSFAAGSIFWISGFFIRGLPFVFSSPLLVFIGALAGGLLVTGLNMGWWENNSPPSQRVKAEVLARHRQWISQTAPTPRLKRGLDLAIALVGLVISLPLWVACILGVWLEDPGPVLFVKNSVGKGGRNFRQYKFRTMVSGAEVVSGPVLAKEQDERVLFFGRLLRKTALDELPQLINILLGDMSFVGPRPQRTVLVCQYLRALPSYADRHRVLPGLAGLAQVAGDYYLTPHQKLRFDQLYIRHAGLGFDLKLILLAFAITFWFRWQPGWNGRLSRRWLRWGMKRSPLSKNHPVD